MIDLHCHILPGVDDGARSLNHAVEMGRRAWDDGIEKIVATPHLFRERLGQSDFAIIQKKREELNGAFREKEIPVQLFPGAEVHISHNLMEEICANRNELVINEGSYMFVEFPRDHVFPSVKELFFDVMKEGISPIIAHPERNPAFMKNASLLYELVKMGVFIQSNAGSFLGKYGKGTEARAFSLLECRLIHFIASDGHGVRAIPPRLSQAFKSASRVVGDEYAWAMVKDNPEAALDDRRLPYLPDSQDPGEKQKVFLSRKPRSFKRRWRKQR